MLDIQDAKNVFRTDDGSYPLPPQSWYVDCATTGAFAGKCPCVTDGTCTPLPTTKVAVEEAGRRPDPIAQYHSVFVWPGMVSTDEVLALANTTVWMDNFFIPYWRGYTSLLNIYMGFQQTGGMTNYPGERPINFSPYTCPAIDDGAFVKQPCAQPGGVGVGKQMNPTTANTAWSGEREYDPRNRGWYIKSTRKSMTGKVQYRLVVVSLSSSSSSLSALN